jgi:hypothetical protein
MRSFWCFRNPKSANYVKAKQFDEYYIRCKAGVVLSILSKVPSRVEKQQGF